MEKYNHQAIEKKWQKYWLDNNVFAVADDVVTDKSYVLDMFPYPSAAGLHVGHPEGYTATDIYCRYLRHKGVKVLHPMGWDAFGLPAENYAIKTGVHPRELTWKNIDNFRRQIQSLGFSYDWNREVNTASPEYYKWTQWLFLELYKKGLAYQKEAPVNWCNSCQTVLANEQVVGGECDRCHNLVEQRLMSQWFFKITEYADRLLKDLDGLDWPEAIVDMQKNWIGKSEGAEVDFPVVSNQVKKFVILHGRSASSSLHFFPSLKEQLEKMGYEVVVPDLPNTDMPDDIEQMEFVKDNIKLDESTVIVGHSMGGVVALRLLEQGIKVSGVILISTPFTGQFLDSKDRPSVTKACQKGFDFEKIKQGANFFSVLGDEGDYAVSPKEAEMFADKLKTKAKLVKANSGHFCSAKEPEVFNICTEAVKIFTTRLDTIFGATYLVLAPEHEAVNKLKSQIINWTEVQSYIEAAKKKTELERKMESKEKTGVKLEGILAVNPANQEKIPVYLADYVLTGYGTGAIMAVPAHDQRDYEFAKKFNLEIRQVIAPETGIKKDKEERRDGGCGIIFDPKTQKYAVLENEQSGMLGFCAGGFDDTKDEQAELMREVEEESGLYDFSYIEKIYTSFNHYYNSLKNVNRFAKSVCYLLILNSVQTKPTQHEEHEKFKLVWRDPAEIEQSFIDHKRQNDTEHWVLYLRQCVTRAVELGYDKINTNYKCDAVVDYGILINSGEFDGLYSEQAISEIAKKIGGQLKTQYRLRDWLISRQRYWGAPIPIIHCSTCGAQPVPVANLPVELPDDVDFRPTGESPLARSESFHKVTCPKCGTQAKRESDTMDTFVDSSWYFLRYVDSQNKEQAFTKDKVKQWLPVDFYVGGAEHAVMHLLYARFFTKVLCDLGYVDFVEPFKKLRNQGLILGEDGQKMSKSRGNVVNPDDVVEQYGADSLRLFEMFLGPLEDVKPWSTSSIIGVRRFLEKIWNLANDLIDKKIEVAEVSDEEYKLQTATVIKKATNDIENFRFNTAISSLMEYINYLQTLSNGQPAWAMAGLNTLLILVEPFAPHLAAEVWSMVGNKEIEKVNWPTWIEKDLEKSTVKVVVQVNGKLRANLEVDKQITQEEIVALAMTNEVVSKYMSTGYKKVIYVPGRLINFVV